MHVVCPQPAENKESKEKTVWCCSTHVLLQIFCTNGNLHLHNLSGKTYNLSILYEGYDFF